MPMGVRMMEEMRIQGELVRCDVIASGGIGGNGDPMGGNRAEAGGPGLCWLGSLAKCGLPVAATRWPA